MIKRHSITLPRDRRSSATEREVEAGVAKTGA
jgi:hypothetical protein